MIIRPELQALRSNDAPQRLAQDSVGQVLDAWRASGEGQQTARELVQFGGGRPLDDLSLLSALFAPQDSAAGQYTANLLGPLLVLMAQEPLTQSPLRYSCNGALTTIILAREGTTTLTLQAVNGAVLARLPAPVSATFSPTETHERVLAGTAHVMNLRIREHFPDRVELDAAQATLRAGDANRRMGRIEAQLLQEVPGSLVSLKLHRVIGAHEVAREYALRDGKLLRQAAGTPRESRLELTAALLGRMGRKDASPLLAAMAEEEGNASLRWQALRECLGLDTARGFAVLCSVAQRSGDPLAAPAGALRAQLLETYPQLAGVTECPA
ncbi:MAG: hypothetical protein ACKOPM_17340 [Novosphingobium sp.]